MPDLAGNIEEIQNSLKASLVRGHGNLDQNVVAASKRVLLQSIEFKPASAPYSMQSNALKAKYMSHSQSSTSSQPAIWNGAAWTQCKKPALKEAPSKGMEGNEECLPNPKVVLYPEELVKMEWTARTPTRIGAGLVNMGNTCFFNSTLQCLTYTAPLVNYCMGSDHRQKCKKKDFCMMCEIQVHIRTSLDCGGRSIKPHSMLQKLRCIAKHMKWGRQEDAHEFLRFLVDHLQQACLHGETKIDKLSKETTVINQIFGGYLRSQVTCLRCQAKSNTFDPFMDLSLDIKGVNTVEDALSKFVKPETLDNENAYKCTKCRNKVRAHKRFSIQKPPNVLTIQLNRFDFNRHLSGKINRFIKYPERINLRNYMSQRQGLPILYNLYGVLVHSGHSSDCGHYYSYVKSPSKTWYCMNDSIVHQANYQSVFSADAYVLFYARVNRSNSTASSPGGNKVQSQSSLPKSSFIGPVLPNHMKQDKSPLTNGVQGKTSSDLGTPVSRLTASSAPKIVSHASNLPDLHKKISFPILTAQQKKQQQDENEDGKRIVLQIKHGNSTTMEKSPDGKSKVVNGNISTLLWQQNSTCLVPYKDDGDSDAEQDSQNVSSSSSSRLAMNHSASQFKNPAGQDNKQQHSVSNSGDNPSVKSWVNSISMGPSKNGDCKSSAHQSGQNSGVRKETNSQQSSSSSSSKAPFVWDDFQSPSKLPDRDKEGHSTHCQKSKQNGCLPAPSPVMAARGVGKPSLALDLGLTSGSKVKTTSSGPLYIHPHEGAPSPRDSCSSTNSVNSTSEWTVGTKVPGIELDKNSLQIASGNDSINGHSRIKSFNASMPSSSNNNSSSSMTKVANCEKLSDRNKKYGSSDFVCGGSSTPVDISDKQPLLSPSSSKSSEMDSKTCKLKKHKVNSNSSSPSDSSKRNSKKKKKIKKHKKGKEKEDSDSDSDAAMSRKKSKNKGQKRTKEALSSESSSSSDEGYEWVEKTIETPLKKTLASHASVQQWNDHMKDDLATRLGDSKGKSKKSYSWDGARQSKVDREFAASNDYNNRVLSWNGGKSQLTRDLEDERENNRKRNWSDEYNEEMDAGKVKKVRNHREDTGYGLSYNPFQEYLHNKKKYNEQSKEDRVAWSHDHSYNGWDSHHHQRTNNGNGGNNYSRHSWHDKSYKYNTGNKVNGSRKHY